MVLFDYDPSRDSAVPTRLLAGYQGYLQVDGYAGYAGVIKENGLVAVGCMAHAKRRFADAAKAQGKKKTTFRPHGDRMAYTIDRGKKSPVP